MTLITPQQGLVLLALFAAAMICLVYFLTRKKLQTNEAFLVADRNVSWLRGAFSIAVSWIWAPAIFICSMQAYTQGIAGAFWFIAPNILCFFVFTPLAIRLRRKMPDGYTLPQYILQRFGGDKKIHLWYLVIFFGYQLSAIVINSLAGGTLLHILTGINFHIATLAIAGVALVYSLISGLEASMLTDVLQMLLILLLGCVLVPWVIVSAGGWSAVSGGLAGVTGEFGDMFDPRIAYAFGIATTIGLLTGPIGDQMFFQRGFAVKQKNIVKTFVTGGLLFGLVPITLCLLGFVAANPAFSVAVGDPQMVGPLTIGHFLPKSALMLFVFMAFAGLSSTLDSAYCAISALGTIDIYKRYFKKDASDRKLLSVSRTFMLSMAIVGTAIALLQPELLWIFLASGTLAAAGFFPTVFSLYSEKVTKKAIFWALGLSIVLGFPLSVYANTVENTNLIVTASLLSIGIGLVVCGGNVLKQRVLTKKVA
ncbi:hypothetical protein H6758_03830 [Candidatus Nomurabacteria bacterium]|nr:hypothetical protein [Candidatus Nomurabacteria bacterium]